MRARFRIPTLLLLVAITACSNRSPERATGSAERAVPPRDVDGRVADVAIDDTRALLSGLRAQVRDPGAGVPIPADAGEVLERWAALPEQVRRHIPQTTRMRAVWFRVGDATRSVAAVKVRLEANRQHPLGVEIALFDGAPEGAKWVAGRPTGGAPVMALKDDVLLVADDQAALGTAIGWLTRTAMPEDAGAGLRVRVPGQAIGTTLRAALDAQLEETAESAIAAARAEAANHTEAPALGDPSEVVIAVRDRARRVLAYLPDVRGITVRLDGGTAGVTLEASADITPGSPLARTLAGMNVGAPFGFSALPASTALAVSARRDPGEPTWTDLLAPIAGERLPTADREVLSNASTTLATMRGDASVLALGAHADGPFVLAGLSPGATPLDPNAVRTVAALPYLANAIGTLVGCAEVRIASLASGRAPLCARTEAPYPEISVQRGEGSAAVMIAARPSANAPAHGGAAALLAAPDRAASDGLFRDPDAQRALDSLGDGTVLAVALSARNVLPTLGLLGSPELGRLAASRPRSGGSSPIVFAISRAEGGALGARLVAPPHSIEDLWSIAYLLMTLAGG